MIKDITEMKPAIGVAELKSARKTVRITRRTLCEALISYMTLVDCGREELEALVRFNEVNRK